MNSEEDNLELYDDSKGTRKVEDIDFGEAEIGKTEEKTLWVKNISKDISIEVVEVISETPEVKVSSFPKFLEPGDLKRVVLQWKLPLTLKKFMTSSLKWRVKETKF